jgi:ubiquitin-conjugating enzyme E2 variant
MNHALNILLQIVLTVLIADFVSGFVHWLEDAYGREEFPITGRLITKPNILHHHNPRHFTRNSWWHSSWDLTCVSALIIIGAWALGHLTWHVWLFAALGANANQIHKWAHRTPQENGWIVSLLQRSRLVQSSRHHARHHSDPKNSHYCVLTDFLNPLLDGVGFWALLECVVLRSFGLRRRIDTSVEPSNANSIVNEGRFRRSAALTHLYE